MQNHFNIEDAKLKNQLATDEADLRRAKEQDCDKLRASMGPSYKDQEWVNRIQIGIVIIAIIISIGLAGDFFGGLVLATIISAIGIICVQNSYKSRNSQKIQQMNAAVQRREAQFTRDLQNLQAQNKRARQNLADGLNRKLNQYYKQYASMNMTKYLVDWLLSAFDVQIKRADRSSYFPHVKASITFSVSPTRLSVPGYGDYDLVRMGINIDSDPTSLSALAYVLEQMVVKEARRRFAIDPNGAPSKITSSWDKNVSVDILYDAPN